jgi:hypothetical protein
LALKLARTPSLRDDRLLGVGVVLLHLLGDPTATAAQVITLAGADRPSPVMPKEGAANPIA